MKIGRHNYESYLLDLLEGRLKEEDRRELAHFLGEHPECATGMEDLQRWVLDAPALTYSGKESLKKQLPGPSATLEEAGFDLFSVARLEGDLTLEQVKSHEEFIAKKAGKRREWELWQKTRLGAKTLKFPGKGRLRRKSTARFRVIWMGVAAAAAVLALLFVLFRGMEELGAPVAEPERMTASPRSGGSDPVSEGTGIPSVSERQPRVDEPDPAKKPAGEPRPSLAPGSSREARPTEGIQSLAAIGDGSPGGTERQPFGEGLPDPSRAGILDRGRYDRISPLQVADASPHLSSLSVTQLTEWELQELFKQYTRENEISLWTLANLGIKGINRLTGSDISLLAAKDNEGEIKGIQLRSRLLSVSTPLPESD